MSGWADFRQLIWVNAESISAAGIYLAVSLSIHGVAALVCYGAVVRLPNAKEPTTLPLRRRYETQRHHQQRDDPVAVQNLRCFTDQAAQRYHQRMCFVKLF